MNCKIGEKIKLLRQQHKMTQEQLADRLGVSYQSVSRWENGITYPDIEYLPAVAKLFSVSSDYLLGQDDEEKQRQIKKRIREIPRMTESDESSLIDLIRLCRREQDDGYYFKSICYALRYSPLHMNKNVLDELRKSKDVFFETCIDTEMRSLALGYYASLEEEKYINAFLDRYASERPISRDYLLKERYLFRDEFDNFNMARQRHFHKQITYLIDGDTGLWRDNSKQIDAKQVLFESETKLAFIHSLCEETPAPDSPVTCGNEPDVFAEQRIFTGMRKACALVDIGEREKAYSVLEDIISLTEKIMDMPEGAELKCASPALDTMKVTVISQETANSEIYKELFYTLENGEKKEFNEISPQWIYECLALNDFSVWKWLDPIRKENRFSDLMERIKKYVKQ